MSSLKKRRIDDNDSSRSATTTTTTTTREFDVLYYKRKNKVHKNKGVSKMDGILRIEDATSVVSLMNGNQNQTTVFRGIQSDICKRADTLAMDDVLQLGAYEVELLSDNKNSTSSTSTASQKMNPPPQASSSSSSLLFQKQKRKPTTPFLLKSSSSSGGASKTFPSSRHSSHGFAQRSSQFQTQTTVTTSTSTRALKTAVPHALDSDEDEDEEEDATRKENVKNAPPSSSSLLTAATNNQKKKKLPGFPTPSLLARGRPRPLGILHKKTTTNLVVSSSSTQQKKRSLPVSSTMKRLSQNNKNNNNNNNNNNNFFPTAIGTPNVPNSIRSVLRPHQIEGVSFLWNCLTGHNQIGGTSSSSNTDSYKGAILADEMGLGKTLMTIAVICALYRQKREMRFLVVCPSSLVLNWAKEFDKWLGKASQPKRVVVQGGGEEGLREIKSFCSIKPSQVLIISYELFRRHSKLFAKTKNVGLLVVDEGHRLKSTQGSQTLTALESLPCDARLCITATPIQNILSDFYTIANFVCPGLFGDLATFRKEYERPISASNNKSATSQQRKLGLSTSQALERITSTFMLRRLQKDVLSQILPPRDEVLLFCRPSPTQCEIYKDLTEALDEDSESYSRGDADALTTIGSLRKLCSHPRLLERDADAGMDVEDIPLSGKLSVLHELLKHIRTEAPDDKIVIVSNFTATLSIIEDSLLKPHGLPFLRLDGTIDSKKRDELVNTFNKTSSERSFAFLLSSKAGGCGLNLIGANRLVMFDPDWNPAADIQAMARVYRQGQTKRCIIYRFFTSGTLEEVIYQRQIQKGNLANLTVDGEVTKSNGKKTGFTPEEIRDCFTLKEDCNCDTKVKVGTQWPAFTGAESLKSQGCVDEPLIALTSNPTLSFVHIVDQESERVKLDAELANEKGSDGVIDDDSDSSDEEFEFLKKKNVAPKKAASFLDDDSSESSSEDEAELEIDSDED